MLNTVIWGFADITTRDAVFNLINNKDINLKKWFIVEKYEDDFKDIDNVEYSFSRFLDNYSGITLLNMPLSIAKYIDNHTRILTINFVRDMYFYGKQAYELLNVIHMVSRYYYTILKENDVDFIMFEDVPHNGWMLTLYYVAKAMGIKTLLCGPTRIENHFMYAFSIEDYGIYKEVPEYNKNIDKISIEEKIENDWFDMRSDWLSETNHSNNKHRFRAFVSPKSWYLDRLNIIKDNKKKYGSIKKTVQKKLIESMGRNFERKAYSIEYKRHVIENVNLDVPYVYYPLHLQPEMNTDVLGGMYCNQLLLLEQLSQIIPDDWIIYAKEHPLQNAYMRGDYFFKQLELLPKVKLVSSTTDTYDLNRNSQFVATLVGTTGWEAISGGKNALVFGQAWYGCLPGVFRYHSGIKLEEIMNYKIDHEEFELAVTNLMKKMGNGIIKIDQVPSVSNFDVKKNNMYVYDFLSFIVRYVEKEDGLESAII
ncbi:MAG: hypothetical protein K6F95_03850 [Selenomonas sp.]|uniref:capsular polysaccharide export protein, LipB/KpsS family n=1 Tax=Selenomonas sp. TaxID=2053611 RepID=UPI0025E5C75C|nr:hypothetical protein [Selenomonas sp.]MCR5757020.1 hypothetical protein [Selenomonas sp.]